MVVNTGLPGRGDQFDSPWWLVFASRFTKFALGSSGGIKYVILVEDSDNGGPSSLTVRIE